MAQSIGTFPPKFKKFQLTLCMDHVEMRIAEQVAEKSEAFFAAMTSHDTLMDQLGKTLTIVRSLRSRLHTVDETVACQAFRALRLQQRRMNHLLVLQKVGNPLVYFWIVFHCLIMVVAEINANRTSDSAANSDSLIGAGLRCCIGINSYLARNFRTRTVCRTLFPAPRAATFGNHAAD